MTYLGIVGFGIVIIFKCMIFRTFINKYFAVRTHIYGIWYIVGRGYHVRWYQYMAGVVWEAK